MPGLLVMDDHGADRPGPVQEDQGAFGKPVINGDHPTPQVDGASDLPNGISINGDHLPVTGKANIPESLLQLPPEIQHITAGYQPFGKLLSRAAQQCYNDLSETIQRMADLPVPSTSGMANGASGHATTISPESNNAAVKRRLAMMEFSRKHHTQFVKLLVLTNWSRRVDQVAKLIDIFSWFREQDTIFDWASHWVGMLRLNMANAKIPNPDINTALEVLSTGKAAWTPDLGYIPPERLGPKTMLRMLRNINTLLTVRLNLHEELPPQLRSFTVQSGRATFIVPGEFELDISIADEDPLARYYFIDFRFLCQPAPELPEGFFRNFLEGHCNGILEQTGLTGCYDFLHNFVLTHKIRTLRKQALELMRGKWADSLRIEDAHRELIVQYWVGMPGPKSWLEIGLESGKSDGKLSWKGPGTPRLGYRWIRDGSHVKDISFNFDWVELSMECMMKQVVASHTNHVLTSIYDKLLSMTPNEGSFLAIETSKTDNVDCRLSVRLKNASDTTIVKIEPFTGRFSLQPWSPVSGRISYELNALRNPAAEGATKVAHQACLQHQHRIERQAEQYGWTILRNLDLKPDHVRNVLRQTFSHTSFFRVRGWDSSWAIVATIGMGGESWWVVKFDNGFRGGFIKTASAIRPEASLGKTLPVSQALLRRVERLALASLSFQVAMAELRTRTISNGVRFEPVLCSTDQVGQLELVKVPALYIRASDLRDPPRSISSPPIESFKWFSDFLRLSHHGYDPSTRKVEQVLKGLLRGKFDTRNLIAATRDPRLSFYPDGSFTIRLKSTLGVAPIETIVRLLRSVARIRACVRILERFHLPIQVVSLDEISFEYGGDQKHTATVNFGVEGSPSLELSPESPHRRIANLLRLKLANPSAEIGFMEFARDLLTSLPLLHAMTTITKASELEPRMYARDADWYRIEYEDPEYKYEIRLRKRLDDVIWHLDDKTTGKGGRSGAFTAALREFYTLQTPVRKGLRSGCVIVPQGVHQTIIDLDKLLRDHTGKAMKSPAEMAQTAKAGNPAAGGAVNGTQGGARPPQGRVGATAQNPKKPEVIKIDDD